MNKLMAVNTCRRGGRVNALSTACHVAAPCQRCRCLVGAGCRCRHSHRIGNPVLVALLFQCWPCEDAPDAAGTLAVRGAPTATADAVSSGGGQAAQDYPRGWCHVQAERLETPRGLPYKHV